MVDSRGLNKHVGKAMLHYDGDKYGHENEAMLFTKPQKC